MVHCGDVVEYIADIPWNGFTCRSLKLQHIHEGGLGTFDLAGQHGLLANVHENEQFRIRQRLCATIQATDSPVRSGKHIQKSIVERDAWIWRKRSRDEGAVAGSLLKVPAGSR